MVESSRILPSTGYGYAADDWRVAATWRRIQGKLIFRQGTSPSEAIILWRRIAGGFTAGQQRALYQDLVPRLRGILVADAKSTSTLVVQEATELLRLAGSLELLPASERSQLGKWILSAMGRKKLGPLLSPMAWTLGRLGARVPMYGPANQLLQVSQVESWIESIQAGPFADGDKAFALMQLARRTGDRYRDVSEGRDRMSLSGWKGNRLARRCDDWSLKWR